MSSSQSSSTSEPGSSTGEEFPGLSVLQKYLPQVPAVTPVQHMMTNEMKLADLVERTGYQIVQRNGQRIYGGPPPNYIGKPPCKGTEVFVGKIPRDMFEYDLVPLFERVMNAQCGNFTILLSLRFCVKSILGILNVQNLPF